MRTVLALLVVVTAVATAGPHDHINATKMKEFPVTAGEAAFSADGKMVAFASPRNDKKEQTISLYSTEGKEAFTAKIDSGDIYALRFSADGKHLHVQASKQIHAFDTQTGKVSHTREGWLGTELPSEAKSNDGKLIAKIEREEKTHITHLSVARDGKQLFRVNVGGGKDMPLHFLRFSPDGKKLALGYHFRGGYAGELIRQGSSEQRIETNPYFTRSVVIIHDAASGERLFTESNLWYQTLGDVLYTEDGVMMLTLKEGHPTLWLLKK